MDNNFVKYHIACDKCGSSDARSVNKNGSSYCFSCNTYFPPEQTKINEGVTILNSFIKGLVNFTNTLMKKNSESSL